MVILKNKIIRNSIVSKGCWISKYCKEKIKGVIVVVIFVVVKNF